MYRQLLVSSIFICYCSVSFGQIQSSLGETTKYSYVENLKNYNALLLRAENQLKQINIVKLNKTGKSQRTTATNFKLNIVNERVLRLGGVNWFEFDISALANVGGTYLDISFIRVGYNTSVFGSSITTNGNIVVTPANVLNIATYNPLSTFVNDNTASEINLPISTSSTFTPLNRWQVTTVATIIMTVRMKIQTCGQPFNISFTSQPTTAGFSWYSPTANASVTSTTIVGYDNVNFSGNITDVSCKPIITFWNNSIPAGENKTITVTGKYFGNSMINGASVIFKNANNGDRYPIASNAHSGGIQPIDLVSWSHNQIIIKLPSIIDSADFYVQGQLLPEINKSFPIGSGKFKVKNALGVTAETGAPIYIPWNVTQYMDYYPLNPTRYRKIHAELVGQNNKGYRILVNNHINTAWSDAKPVIKKAMHDWSCATGINWYYGGDTTKKYSNFDGICVIDTADIYPLMSTHSALGVCQELNGPKFYLQSFDIKIKQNVSPSLWNRDTANGIPPGSYDFYSLISHEFGHGHQLSHINDSIKDLMWYQASSSGFSSLLTRKTVKGSPEAVSGGNFVTDSLLGILSCVPTMTLVYPSNCVGVVKINKLGADALNISVFPNPSYSYESVKIKSNLLREGDVGIIVYDMTGKQLVNERIGKTNIIDYDLQTNLLSEGIYLLQVNISGRQQSFKILKE
jgi:hypothetical protein